MTILTPESTLSRRARDRISSSVMPGGVVDVDRRRAEEPAARARRGKSSTRSMPLRSRWASIRASLVEQPLDEGLLAHLE